ncbi:MAG TPA: hypothetical protein VFE46_02160 [Pirellulales bacterium]|jgi:hypothetical protein|nr:hypothetical protein [Pirellulales bacterium]
MKVHRNLKRNRWGVERLEDRRMLAGNVYVANDGGALVITGDSAANVFTLTQTAANTFKVTGSGTTVHGTNPISGIYNGIFIDMTQGGNDVVTLKNVNIQGQSDGISLGVLLGNGNNTLVLTGVTTELACGIVGGSKVNAITITQSFFGYDLSIEGGNSTDAVTITKTTVDGGLFVSLCNGTNAFTMSSVAVTKADPPCSPYGDVPYGFESLNYLPFIDCGADIFGGSGTDVDTLSGVSISCLTQINTYQGNDVVTIVNSSFGDAPTCKYSCWDDTSGLCIETGVGNDVVTMTSTTVYGFLQIDTSGDICCPCTGESTDLSYSSGKDGNDVVTLVKVNVLQSQESVICCECGDSGTESGDNVEADNTQWGCCDFCALEEGMLLIYTGNQTDVVTLTSVNIAAETSICTTDFSSLDGTDVVTITNSNFNYDNQCVGSCCCLAYCVPAGLEINTGAATDVVTLSKVNVVGESSICTGDSNDVVTVNALVADYIFINMDGGTHDVLTIVNSSSPSIPTFLGVDTLVQSHNHFG